MLPFRLTLVALVGWLFLFYNIERIHEPLNIASFIYVLSALGCGFLIIVGGQRQRLSATCFVSVVLLLVLKAHWNYPTVGAALPITVTEVVAMMVTFWLATRLAEGVQRFEEGSFELTMVSEKQDLEHEQTEMYGEVRRAREFERPLTVAYIRGDTREFEQALHPLIVQSQRAAAERYARAKVADAIGEELRECDMFAMHQDGFLLVLPEANRENAKSLLEKVTRALSDRFNLTVEAGLASLPEEQVTFSGLLEHAMNEARSSQATSQSTPEASLSTAPSQGAQAVKPRSLSVPDCYFDPTLSVSLRLHGEAAAIENYLHQLRTNFGDRWHRQTGPPPAAMEIDIKLTNESLSPPQGAVAVGGDWFEKSTLYRPQNQGWLQLCWMGGDHWSLTGTAAEGHDFSLERAMFRISSLRGGGLPLHASVGRFQDLGLAALGMPESGKTAVLLALLELGGQWICDDEAYCEADLITAHGSASEIQIKQRYLAQLPHLSRRMRRVDRWNQGFSVVARRLAGGASRIPTVPKPMRRRLRRVAEGQASTPMSPPGRLPATPIDVAMIVSSGRTTQLDQLDPATWSARAAEILWPEVRELHEIQRRMQAATGGALVGEEAEDELRLKTRIMEFAESKHTCQLIRSPQTPLEELSKLLSCVWEDAVRAGEAPRQDSPQNVLNH